VKKSLLSVTAISVGIIAASLFAAPAMAAHVGVGINIGVPLYAPAPPVYYAPAPVYVPPPPVYVRPAPVYVAPAPVYVERDVYYRRGYGPGYYRHGYHHPGRGYHDRRW
jgi:hypothetical protein